MRERKNVIKRKTKRTNIKNNPFIFYFTRNSLDKEAPVIMFEIMYMCFLYLMLVLVYIYRLPTTYYGTTTTTTKNYSP